MRRIRTTNDLPRDVPEPSKRAKKRARQKINAELREKDKRDQEAEERWFRAQLMEDERHLAAEARREQRDSRQRQRIEREEREAAREKTRKRYEFLFRCWITFCLLVMMYQCSK